MRTFDSITGYVWRGDTFCKKCIRQRLVSDGKIKQSKVSIENVLTNAADKVGIDRDDEWSFDCWNFPKVVFQSDSEFWPAKCTVCGSEV